MPFAASAWIAAEVPGSDEKIVAESGSSTRRPIASVSGPLMKISEYSAPERFSERISVSVRSSMSSRALCRKSEIVSRSEEHTSELQSLMRISYAVFCLKKKKKHKDVLIQ